MGRLLILFARALVLLVATPSMAFAQDANQGRALFQTNCAVCHQAVSNGRSMIGPNLFGIVGRHAASVTGFAYSPAMQHSGITWTNERLLAYVQAPAATVPGNRMPYAGLHNPQQAASIIAYLGTLH